MKAISRLLPVHLVITMTDITDMKSMIVPIGTTTAISMIRMIGTILITGMTALTVILRIRTGIQACWAR
jgi:hypothetical protein